LEEAEALARKDKGRADIGKVDSTSCTPEDVEKRVKVGSITI
jgi:hypothetical protein